MAVFRPRIWQSISSFNTPLFLCTEERRSAGKEAPAAKDRTVRRLSSFLCRRQCVRLFLSLPIIFACGDETLRGERVENKIQSRRKRRFFTIKWVIGVPFLLCGRLSCWLVVLAGGLYQLASPPDVRRLSWTFLDSTPHWYIRCCFPFYKGSNMTYFELWKKNASAFLYTIIIRTSLPAYATIYIASY